MPAERLVFDDLRIEGASRAGEESWFRVHPPGLAFDVGRGPLELTGASDLFLSHGHLDHALGLPFLLSHRSSHQSRSTRIFAPAPIVSALVRWIEAAETLEEATYRFEALPLEPGATGEVGKDLAVEAFATSHGVPSLGFHLLRSRRCLRDEYRDKSGADLARLRHQGVAIERDEVEILMSYCGDTGPEVFDLEPRIFGATVLLLECTFIDEESRSRARGYGHMHLDDLVTRAEDFANRDLILHHFSRRYQRAALQEAIARRFQLPRTRIHLFGC